MVKGPRCRVTAGANALGGLANAVGRLSTDIARLVGVGHLAGSVAAGLGLWADALQPASWNGIPFAVRASQIRRGRRIVVHEHPFRADAWVEDLGRFSRALARSTPPRAR